MSTGPFSVSAPLYVRQRTDIAGGVRVELIEHPLMRKIRSLDKPVDALAKDRPMEKILRTAPSSRRTP
ncbi:MAG: DUF2200 family protein [Gemmatimonadaceae bacterium]|nr:DUF2200 family protein [Gemmatimonadaceae bacterium]